MMAGSDVVSEEKWLGKQIRQYTEVRPRYQAYANVLERVLRKAALRYDPLATVQARPKTVVSFGEKALRERDEFRDPVHQFTDLCGARIIAHTRDEVAAVGTWIAEHFEVDPRNTVTIDQRLGPAEFGYRSVHYIVRLGPRVPVHEGLPRPPRQRDVRLAEGLWGEVQVRTLLEHAWADFSHDRTYKSAFTVPKLWQRELNALSAVLENADGGFSRIDGGLASYASSYGAYLSPEQRAFELAMLQTIRRHDRKDVRLAARIANLAIASADWQLAVDVLSEYRTAGAAALLRDLGMATCKLHAKKPRSAAYREGQRYLEEAMALDPKDVDAIASLAGTWRKLDPERARALYQRAFEVDPTYPYALSCHVDCRLTQSGNMMPIASLRPLLEGGIRRCRDQIAVELNMPWAYYDLGKFHLLLGCEHEGESFAAHAKAVERSTAAWQIGTSLRALEGTTCIASECPAHQSMTRLLRTGLAARFPQTDEGREAREALLGKGGKKVWRLQGPVVIIAGATGTGTDRARREHEEAVRRAFAGFHGTVLGGGTKAGVSGLVGALQRRYPKALTTVGYLPRRLPAGESPDDRYRRFRRSDGRGFSPLEPLLMWKDLLASEVRPEQVRLLGLGGGAVAAAEYRLALALGARVALLQGSGGAAGELLADTDWDDCPRRLELSPDVPILQSFLAGQMPVLDADIRERIAEAVHETYRRNQKGRKGPADPAMVPWESLDEGLKESNRQQADHYTKLLAAVGCRAHRVSDRPAALMTFSGAEVETMAEMEHARWVIERESVGWKLGKERNVAKKISPYLVPWSKLPDEVREYDRETVRALPTLLAGVGLEIRRDLTSAP